MPVDNEKLEALRKRLRQKPPRFDWKPWIGSPIAWLGLIGAVFNGLYNFGYYADDLVVVVDPPSLQGETSKLVVKLPHEITFISSGNRPIVVSRLQLRIIQSLDDGSGKTSLSQVACRTRGEVELGSAMFQSGSSMIFRWPGGRGASDTVAANVEPTLIAPNATVTKAIGPSQNIATPNAPTVTNHNYRNDGASASEVLVCLGMAIVSAGTGAEWIEVELGKQSLFNFGAATVSLDMDERGKPIRLIQRNTFSELWPKF